MSEENATKDGIPVLSSQDNIDNNDLQSRPLMLEDLKFETLNIDKLESLEKENTNDIETPNANNSTNLNSYSDYIPFQMKVLFSLPAFCKMSCLVILNVQALLFYENKGSSLLLISFFTALARCIEIILKPVVAHWSDNSDFKMGRRKPFMLFGCGFYSLFLILLFAPSSSFTRVTTSIWFGIFYVFFFIADTVCNIPYQALGPEMSRDTNEREKLYMVFYFFQYIGVLFVSAAPVIIKNFLPTCACKQCDLPTVVDKSSCIFDCNMECSSKKDEQSLLYMTMFMGIFFVLSIILLSIQIKEKREYLNKEKVHLVPTLYRLFSNQPFIRVLLPWVIDATAVQIFATMLPFYLSYIISPQKYCRQNKIDSSSSVCSSTHWIGITISVFFTFCIVFTFIWHWLVQFLGKKKSWQACSLISVLTFSLFLVCEEGSMVLMTIFSAINSFPAGGGYLNDVFVSDVIDYDEFITGSRNEGIYIVFSSFTPKIVGIFAQSIPLTVLSLIGFVPSINGKNHDQPIHVKEFIRFYFIAVPVLLALISFVLKMKYPIDSELKMLKLKNAIRLQNQKVPEMKERVDYYKVNNPIYNTTHIQIFCKNENQKHSKIVADHFYDLDYLNLILKGDYCEIKKTLIKLVICFFVVFVIFLVVLIFTFKYLEIKSLSLIPIFSLFIVTISLLMLLINIARYIVISKVINKEYIIDEKYIMLYIYQMKYLKESSNKDEGEGPTGEFGRLAEDCGCSGTIR